MHPLYKGRRGQRPAAGGRAQDPAPRDKGKKVVFLPKTTGEEAMEMALANEGNGGNGDTQELQLRAAKISIAGSLLLFVISAAVGILVDSITLILDASASLVILATAFLMRFSAGRIHRPPDELYHFGYHKYEPLTATVQNLLILATCAVSIKFAIQDIVHAESVDGYGLPVLATLASGIIGLAITGYLRSTARITASQMVQAAAFHWLSDAALSFGVCAGFGLGYLMETLGYHEITPYIDPVMAIVLALVLMAMPLKVGMHGVFELLDASPPPEVRKKIQEVIELHRAAISGLDRLRVRKAGAKVFVDVCFTVRRDLTVAEAETLAQGFAQEVGARLPGSDVTVGFRAAKD
jgi:cation diffusion facilitator family transporter